MMASCMVGFHPHLANMCNTFTVHHKANRLVTQRHIVKTDVWLSTERSSLLIFDQFINSISREVIKVTPKSGLRLVREAHCKWQSRTGG